MLRLERRGSRERSPCVSTGRSIHAVPSITPPLREGIEDRPRLPALVLLITLRLYRRRMGGTGTGLKDPGLGGSRRSANRVRIRNALNEGWGLRRWEARCGCRTRELTASAAGGQRWSKNIVYLLLSLDRDIFLTDGFQATKGCQSPPPRAIYGPCLVLTQ
jgi:hypothetical protein